MQKVRPWCGQTSDRGRLKNRTELLPRVVGVVSRKNEVSGSVSVLVVRPLALIRGRDIMSGGGKCPMPIAGWLLASEVVTFMLHQR